MSKRGPYGVLIIVLVITAPSGLVVSCASGKAPRTPALQKKITKEEYILREGNMIHQTTTTTPEELKIEETLVVLAAEYLTRPLVSRRPRPAAKPSPPRPRIAFVN